MLDKFGECPICTCSWFAGDIPEESREHYSPPYKFSRLIGVEVRGVYDGMLIHQCPDCSSMWSRFSHKLLRIGEGNGTPWSEVVEMAREEMEYTLRSLVRPL